MARACSPKNQWLLKNIEVTEDLYFNEGYKDNFTWETTYQNDSEKDILNNFAYVLRGRAKSRIIFRTLLSKF